MQIENMAIANLNCDGGANVITKKNIVIMGAEKIVVDLKTNNMFVNHNDYVNSQEITDALLSIGYLEATEENKLLTYLKSIVSFLFSKISNSKYEV